nr:hypothetical protein Iba_chr07aCG8060 [Ipomoea batatas]
MTTYVEAGNESCCNYVRGSWKPATTYTTYVEGQKVKLSLEQKRKIFVPCLCKNCLNSPKIFRDGSETLSTCNTD